MFLTTEDKAAIWEEANKRSTDDYGLIEITERVLLEKLKQQEPIAWVNANTIRFIQEDKSNLVKVQATLHQKNTFNGKVPLYVNPVPAAAPAAPAIPDVDWLSNVIRAADGGNNLGAGALAEKIITAMQKGTKNGL